LASYRHHWPTHYWLAAPLIYLLAILPAAADGKALAELEDAVSRAQYAYYTDDPRTLQAMAELMERLSVPDALTATRGQYLAYAYWRLAQLAAAKPASVLDAPLNAGVREGRKCVQTLTSVLARQPKLAEAQALLANCQDVASLAVGFVRGRCAESPALNKALALEPHNPRVLYVEALCLRARTPRAGAPSNKLVETAKSAVEAFEAASPSLPGTSSWGHAEALTLLGEIQLELGDALTARDTLERALVLAPDYLAAKRLLARATGQEKG
jgi:tetratricopeptide (TPR) repeat protein